MIRQALTLVPSGRMIARAIVRCGGSALLATASIRAQTLPDRLSDTEFWKIVTEFSENTGTFSSENFTSNETGFQMVIPRLLQVTRPGGVYLGVGPEQNFTYIVALQPRLAFITDIRRQNLQQHLLYKALFELYDNRADFLSHLFSRPRPAGLDTNSSPAALFAAFNGAGDPALEKKNLADVLEQLTRKHGFKLADGDSAGMAHVMNVFATFGGAINYNSNTGGGFGGGRGGGQMVNYATLMQYDDGAGMNRSFLGSEANYRRMRDFEMRNALIPVVGDFGGDKALKAVAKYLTDHKATVTAFYCSNVEQYLFQPTARTPNGGYVNFYNTLATMPLDSASTFIRSGRITGGGGGGRGGLSQSLLAPMQSTIAAVKAGQVYSWQDILNMSRP